MSQNDSQNKAKGVKQPKSQNLASPKRSKQNLISQKQSISKK